MVDDDGPGLAGLFGKHLFLVAAVILDKHSGLAWKGMAFEQPAAVPAELHVNAPRVPHFDDFQTALQRGVQHVAILVGAHHAFQRRLTGGGKIAVHLGNIAGEMIVSARA